MGVNNDDDDDVSLNTRTTIIALFQIVCQAPNCML